MTDLAEKKIVSNLAAITVALKTLICKKMDSV